MTATIPQSLAGVDSSGEPTPANPGTLPGTGAAGLDPVPGSRTYKVRTDRRIDLVEVRWLVDGGTSVWEIAHRLGVTVGGLERAARRAIAFGEDDHGLHELLMDAVAADKVVRSGGQVGRRSRKAVA